MGISIPQRTSSGTAMIPMDSKNFEARTIWIEGEIDEKQANEFAKEIIELNRQDTTKAIKVLINSCGGMVIYGLAMYDIMLTSKAPIETYCMGAAYSMAAVLLAAGNRRYMLEHSKVMLHEPLIGNGVGGSASSVQSMSDSLQQTKNQINEILCKHTGRTKKQMEKATNFDNYFSAKEAIEFGLVDEIAGLEKLI